MPVITHTLIIQMSVSLGILRVEAAFHCQETELWGGGGKMETGGRWTRGARAAKGEAVRLRVLLGGGEEENARLEALVRARTDPRSPSYGRFMDLEQLKAHFGASPAVLEALQALSEGEGVNTKAIEGAGDAWELEMPVEGAERLFKTRLFEFSHVEMPDVRVVRPGDEFELPEAIKGSVLFVDGLQSFPTEMQARAMQKRLQRRKEIVQDSDRFEPPLEAEEDLMLTRDDVATPDVIRKQYQVPHTAAAGAGEGNLVIGTFLQEFYRVSDIKRFVSKFGGGEDELRLTTHGDCVAHTNQLSVRSESTHQGGGDAAALATGEASLDVQVAVGVARGAHIDMMCYTSLRDPKREFAADNQEPFLEFMLDVNAMDPPPSVVSVSYTDDECSVPVAYARAVNRELMKSALRGITVVISAGDAGVQASNLAGFCRNMPNSVTSKPCDRFLAMFPASSPYATSVGATSMELASPTDPDGLFHERVTSTRHDDALITSGGGFSELFPMPEYQRRAVSKYLAYADEHGLTSMFNASGRAYPDIAAVGHAFPVVVNGELTPTDGTSVSAPVLASLVVLLNSHRASQGKAPLGFLNPLLYALQDECPHVFRDITDGETSCGSVGMSCCPRGHVATEGWDAASGVGALRFEVLIKDLDDCLERIQRQGIDLTTPIEELRPSTSLLEVEATAALRAETNAKQHWTTPEERIALQALITVAFVAGVSLLAVLVSLRRQLFAPRRANCDRYYACHARESAREYLLGRSSEQ